jgi:mRNA interferase RelE/StbE
MYAIRLTHAAERSLSNLPRDAQRRIGAKIDALANDPLPRGVRKLQGSDFHRLRVGDYRIIFSVEHDVLTVVVIDVGHRRDIYR